MADPVSRQLSLLAEAPLDDEPTDQEARQVIAGELARTLFVEAGAGSGKTRALVDRVEALVLSGQPMESIAAITFTEKAAAELRDRIRRRFELRAEADPRSRPVVDTALQQLDGAAVGTLHSFAQRILGDHPVEAGLPPGVELLDEIASQVELESRWRDFVDGLLDDAVLGRSLLLLEIGGVKLDHLRALAVKLGDNWDLVDDHLDLHAPDPPPVDAIPLADRISDLDALRGHCADPDDRLLARLDELLAIEVSLRAAHDDLDTISLVDRLAKRCRVGQCGSKRNWSLPIGEVRSAVAAIGERAGALVESTTRSALARLVGALGRFTLEAAEHRRASGRLEFHDLLVRARRLLRDPNHGPTVRASLRERYQRLLLDEFQDTDPIQVELAVLLATPEADVGDRPWWELDVEPGRLFFVGDPKQSIYRFRRADIGVFLQARDRFDDRVTLTRNFRTVAPVISWVNEVFGSLIQPEPRSQPEYVPLEPHRLDAPPVGPAVAVLGSAATTTRPKADELRAREAEAVAEAVATVLHEGWSVDHGEPDTPDWQPARAGDICILLPARTSLSALERALDHVGVPYRAETSSLVYATREVRDLMLVLRAVADPTDELATVAGLRSPLYGCGDDDLAHWRLGCRGRFSLLADPPDDVPDHHPVAEAMAHMAELHRARSWSSPAQLLDRLVRERAAFESAVATGRPREVWRRLRFVIDQARAWSDAGGTDLRSYLEWAALQGADNARVSETVLPETDDDSVRILTVHGAKGLEFPITVLAGMTTKLINARRGPTVAFPPGEPAAIRLKAGVQSESFERWEPIDEQMDAHERLRLLYVAATRARDHLIVSLVRVQGGTRTWASELVAAGADRAVPLEPTAGRIAPPAPRAAGPLIDRATWARERDRALHHAARRRVIAATTLAREAADATDPGLDKRSRDLELPPWNKGRYGTAVGRAVHGVLQVIDLATGDGIEHAAAAQAVAEGVASRRDIIEALARSALTTEVARSAAGSRHWRELWVAAPVGDRLVEGYIDLLYLQGDELVVVDWKTDHLDDDHDVTAKLARYRLQGASYAAAVTAACDRRVARVVFAFLAPDGAVEAELPDLDEAIAEVRARASEGGFDDLVMAGDADTDR